MNARPYDSVLTKTLTTTEHFPRGLVVRIRRSHRRGPGSIPGVEFAFLYFSLRFITPVIRNYARQFILVFFLVNSNQTKWEMKTFKSPTLIFMEVSSLKG